MSKINRALSLDDFRYQESYGNLIVFQVVGKDGVLTNFRGVYFKKEVIQYAIDKLTEEESIVLQLTFEKEEPIRLKINSLKELNTLFFNIGENLDDNNKAIIREIKKKLSDKVSEEEASKYNIQYTIRGYSLRDKIKYKLYKPDNKVWTAKNGVNELIEEVIQTILREEIPKTDLVIKIKGEIKEQGEYEFKKIAEELSARGFNVQVLENGVYVPYQTTPNPKLTEPKVGDIDIQKL